MTDANVTPGTIGGFFTRMVVFLPQPLVTYADHGRTGYTGFTGTGSTTNPDSLFTDNGSTSTGNGTWIDPFWAQDLKLDPWSPAPGNWRDFTLGSCETHIGDDNYIYTDPNPPSSPSPGTFAYFDNDFQVGEVGPSQNAVRTARDWVAVCQQPNQGVSDTGSVKLYTANQFSFSNPIPAVSSFAQILSYAQCQNPYLPASAHPEIIYEAAWDIFGVAHWDRTNPDGSLAISLEIMFWTRNHNQGPFGFLLVETGVDLNGDGLLWNLYMTQGTATDGGVADKYSYCIWYLQEQFQGETTWVNVLAGCRYVLMHYVKTSGPMAVTNPLDCPLIQVTRGWEVCSTNYTPLSFRHLDYKLLMA